ncbi:Ino eighty subunit 5 [Lachancea thermotolerans]
MTSSKIPVPSKEYAKQLSRREELTKQESSLKREYTTMLRKMASVMAVLQELDDGQEASQQTISESALLKVPELKQYSQLLHDIDNKALEDIEIPEVLKDSYALYKQSPLLYKDL